MREKRIFVLRGVKLKVIKLASLPRFTRNDALLFLC